MAGIQLERTLVKSAPELWDEITAAGTLTRCLGEVRVKVAEAPARLEWDGASSTGVIELESSGWGTRVRANAKSTGLAWERVNKRHELQRSLEELLDRLGTSSLKRG